MVAQSVKVEPDLVITSDSGLWDCCDCGRLPSTCGELRPVFNLFKKKPPPEPDYKTHVQLMSVGMRWVNSAMAEEFARNGWPMPGPDRAEDAIGVIAPLLVLDGIPSPDIVDRMQEKYQLLYVDLLRFFQSADADASLPPDKLRHVKIGAWAFVFMYARAPESQADWDCVHYFIDLFTKNRKQFLRMAAKIEV